MRTAYKTLIALLLLTLYALIQGCTPSPGVKEPVQPEFGPEMARATALEAAGDHGTAAAVYLELARRSGKLHGAGSDAHTLRELGGASVTVPQHENHPQAFLRAMAAAVVDGETSSNLVHLASTWAKVRKRLPGAVRY